MYEITLLLKKKSLNRCREVFRLLCHQLASHIPSVQQKENRGALTIVNTGKCPNCYTCLDSILSLLSDRRIHQLPTI